LTLATGELRGKALCEALETDEFQELGHTVLDLFL
jgi:hypothetical protein